MFRTCSSSLFGNMAPRFRRRHCKKSSLRGAIKLDTSIQLALPLLLGAERFRRQFHLKLMSRESRALILHRRCCRDDLLVDLLKPFEDLSVNKLCSTAV